MYKYTCFTFLSFCPFLFSRPTFQSTWLSPAIGQINHPGGIFFYWLIISQLRFHEHTPANSSTPLITHTFKIFIIKRIRLCSLKLFFFFFPRRPFRGSAWLRFISTHSRGGTGLSQRLSSPSSTGQTLLPLCFMLQCSNHYRPGVTGCFVKLQGTED